MFRKSTVKKSEYVLDKSLDEIKQLPIVKVTVIDHATGAAETIEVEVYGRLLHQDEHITVLLHWLPLDTDQDSLVRNWELTALGTALIKSITTLWKPKKKATEDSGGQATGS